jgi:hypothetical protein
VQINTHGEQASWSASSAARLHRLALPLTHVLQQIDGGEGEQIYRDLLAAGVPVLPFYDLSHGAGVVPDAWPRSERYAGYGGGLGPENLEIELRRIDDAAAGGSYWIDMETRVRSVVAGRSVLDLDRVEQCLAIAARFRAEQDDGDRA